MANWLDQHPVVGRPQEPKKEREQDWLAAFPVVDAPPRQQRESQATLGDYVRVVDSGLGRGIASLSAGLGQLAQAPVAGLASGLAGAAAAIDRGRVAAKEAVGIDAEPARQTQAMAQRMARIAEDTRTRRAQQPWALHARLGRGLEQVSAQSLAELRERDAQHVELAQQQANMQQAQGFMGTLGAVRDNPLAFTHTLAQSLPATLAGVGAGAIAARSGAGLGTVGTVGIASEAGLGAAQARYGVYEQVSTMPLEQLQHSPRFVEILAATGGDGVRARSILANELADQVPVLAGAGTALGTVLTNRLFGGDATAKALTGGARVTLPETAKRIAQEAVEEGIQSVPEALASHGAMVQADPSQDFDLGGTVAQGMAAGLVMGAGGHGARYAMDRRAGPAEPPADETAPVEPPPAPAPIEPAQTQPAAPPPPAEPTEAQQALLQPVTITALDRAQVIADELDALEQQAVQTGTTPDTDARQQQLERELTAITGTWPAAVPGAPTRFSTEAGVSIDARYALIDASDLITSHALDLRANPLYPQDLQPRDRTRAASELQVSKIAQGLDPQRLGSSGDATSGAPIIGADGLVESGNARTIAIKRAYQAGGQKIEDYKGWLRDHASEFGLDPQAVDTLTQPVLVRVRQTPVNRAEFAKQANMSQIQRMSASEQALSDAARLVSLDGLDPADDGDFSSSRDFISQFMALLPTTEQAEMLEADGKLSTTGYRRIQNAVLAKAYGDSPTLRRMTESMDDNLRNVSKALVRVAPVIAETRGRMQAGALHEADIVPDLLQAVEGMAEMKDRGVGLEQELSQQDLSGPKYTAESQTLLRMLSDNIRSPRRIAEFLQHYHAALEQAGDPRQGDMLGPAPAPTRAELLSAAAQQGVPNDTTTDAQRGEHRASPPIAEPDRQQSEDAPGSRSSDQGDGIASTDAAGGQPGAATGAASAANEQSAAATGQPAAQQVAPGRARKAKGEGVKAPTRTLNEDGRATDGKPINPGDVFATLSGRQTTGYPKQKGEKYASQWLINNALMEAEARGDSFNASMFSNIKPLKNGELTPADSDSMLMYLFGEQPAVVPSILKPLTGKTEAKTERQPVTTQQPTTTEPEAAKSPAERAMLHIKDFLAKFEGRQLDAQRKFVAQAEDKFGIAKIAGFKGGFTVHVVDRDDGNATVYMRGPSGSFAEAGTIPLKDTAVYGEKSAEPLLTAPTLEKGGRPLTADEKQAKRIDGDAIEFGMTVEQESVEPDFDPAEIPVSLAYWIEQYNLPAERFTEAVIANIEKRKFRRKAGVLAALRKAAQAGPTPAEAASEQPAPTTDEKRKALDESLKAGMISVEDYMKATGLTDEDTGPIGNGLRQQADRIAKERSPYHQAINKIHEALSEQMRKAMEAPVSTPPQRKAKEERIARINRDRDTLDMIARNFEHPFQNTYVTKLSPNLRERFENRFSKIQTGFQARDAFNNDSYSAWADLLIEAANKKQSAPGTEPLLTSPTVEEVVARQDAAEAAQREAEAADRKAAEDERKRQERAEIARRSEAAADTFELGQDPMANLTGQGGIFSAPAEPEPAAPTLTYTPASQIDSPTQGVLANAKERKARAFARLKSVRQQVKDGTANRLELLKAESAHKDAVREVEAAEAQLERDANRLGLTTVREDGAAYNATYETDLFGNPVPAPAGSRRRGRQTAAQGGDVQPAAAVQGDTPAPAGDYYARTVVGKSADRQLGADRILTPQDAAQATAYLYRSAVERFDAIVTDKDGKPLAVVGNFKGAVSQTSVYPATVVGEAVRVPGAARIWFSHNHPSGVASLSSADKALNQTLADVFRGSGIEPMGILAVTGDRFAFSGADGSTSTGEIPAPKKGVTVPVIERALKPASADRQQIENPQVALQMAGDLYKAAGSPGVMILDAQHRLAAWMPLPPVTRGNLRDTGGLNALYRGVSESNAGAAILVHGGELDARVGDGSVTASQNIAAALTKVDVRVLDSINAVTRESVAETVRTPEKGPVFSRTPATDRPTPQGPATVEMVQQVVDAITPAWAQRPEIVIAQSMQDPVVPEAVRNEDAAQRKRGATGVPSGFYYQGKVHLIADGLSSPRSVVETLYHEALGHHGLRSVFGDSLDGILDQIALARPELMRAKAKQYGKANTLAEARAMVLKARPDLAGAALDSAAASRLQKHRREVAEEVLAGMSQTKPNIGFVKRAIAAIRTWLRQNVPALKDMALTDAEIIQNYILPARGWVERGERAMRPGGKVALLRAYHGTPHRGIQKFSTDFIGTGEGAQAYGWGLYFADKKEIAERYRMVLSSGYAPTVVKDGQELSAAADIAEAYYQIGDIHSGYGGNDKVLDFDRQDQYRWAVKVQEVDANGEPKYGTRPRWHSTMPDFKDLERRLKAKGYDIRRGQLYEVNIPEDSEMLLWDKPLSEQPEGVRRALSGYAPPSVESRMQEGFSRAEAEADYKKASRIFEGTLGKDFYGQGLPPSKAKERSLELAALGIKGIKYLDGTSRATGDGSYNYVIFSGDDVAIQQTFFSRAQDQTQTEAFERWFGGSKVVDADGKPLVVYHGTGGERTVFEPYWKQLERDAMPHELKGNGSIAQMYQLAKEEPEMHFFAAERGTAESYGPDVVEAYLKIDNMVGDPSMDRDEAIQLMLDQDADGAIFRDTTSSGGYGGVAYVVRRSNQIKSAIGNNGQFDPTNPDIRFSRSPATLGSNIPAWSAPEKAKWDDFVYKIQDRHVDLKRVTAQIKEVSGAIDDAKDTYLREEMYHSRVAKRIQDFINDELNPLVEDMRRTGVTMKAIERFMQARHAPEANAVIAQRNPGVPDLQDGGSGMTNAEAQAHMASLKPAERKHLESAAAKIDAIIKQTRQTLVGYELETQAVVDSWAQLFPNYVPLFREGHDDSFAPGIAQGFGVRGRETQSRTGSTAEVKDIFANIMMQRERAITRGEKNRVGQSLVALAESNPNADWWQVDSAPTKRVYDHKLGVVVNKPDLRWKERPNAVVVKFKNKAGLIVERAVVFSDKNERAKRMAAAMKSLDLDPLQGVMGIMASVTRYFAMINTQYNPVFGPFNMLRDIKAAMIQVDGTPIEKDRGKILSGIVPAIAGIYLSARKERKGKHQHGIWAGRWDEFQKVGGPTGFRAMFETSEDRAHDIRATMNPDWWTQELWGKAITVGGILEGPLKPAKRGMVWVLDWLSDYNLALENGVRLAAYQAAIDRGQSKERAASLAKNLTINFNRRGQVGLQAGALYAFFNSAIQGTARMGETLTQMEPGKPKSLRLNSWGRKVVYGGLLLGAMQALAMAAAGFDDEDPPQFIRDRSLIIPLGNGRFWSQPLPLGYHVIPAIGRSITEFVLGGFQDPEERVMHVMELMLNAFNPLGHSGLSIQTIAPTPIDPLVALGENRDWTGRQIAQKSMNPATPGTEMASDQTMVLWRWMAAAINRLTGGNEFVAGGISPNPDQFSYLFGQITGGVGRETERAWQTGTAIVTGDEVATHRIPMVGRFVGSTRQQASKAATFRGHVQELNRLETEIRGLREAGRMDEARALRDSRPEARLITAANSTETRIRTLRNKRSELIQAGASREDVRAMNERITAEMLRFNEAMAKLKQPEQELVGE